MEAFDATLCNLIFYLVNLPFTQGCQIIINTIYQNEGKYTKLPQHYQKCTK
jgi:hypothetical protein